MPEENLRHVPGTKIYLTGSRHFKLTNPNNVKALKRMGVEKVFLIYRPTPEGIRTAHGMSEEQERFFEAVSHAGIRVAPLLRDTHNLRDYESFHREASAIKGKIVVECVEGRHASGAYAAYHLAKATRLSYEGIVKRLMAAGLERKDIATINVYLKHAGANLKEVIAERDRRILQRKKFKGALREIGKKKKQQSRRRKG